MNRKLAIQELAYLFDHLEHIHPGSGLAGSLVYGSLSGEDLSSYLPAGSGVKIFFPPSDQELDLNKVFMIEDLPVLFPCSDEDGWYKVEKNQIRFHHDILKSAFYLLSGYQEYQSQDKDEHGRFPWKSSIQHRLGITQKPIVNYYFSVILEAFEKCLEINQLESLTRKETPPILFLSHDVDRIVKYSLRDVAYQVLVLAGLNPSEATLSQRWRRLLACASGTFLFKKDPYWNFSELLDLEESLGIRSTWYMLEKTSLENSRYHFRSKKIQGLISLIEDKGHEIGIHGTLESSDDLHAMITGLKRLGAVTKHPVRGCRQHYLKYNNPLTTRIHEKAGIGYDSTLGFAEQIGFRNSYALPFKLYDFENQAPFSIWQIPLLVMDVSLIGYMGTSTNEIPFAIKAVIEEVQKFNGVLTLLWHNCQLDEEEYPGINKIYSDLLKNIVDSGFVSMSGTEVLESIISSDV
jgi:peptidoglycan/xylan/chitin deacetylase (PgdA/CDA1 family)